MNPLEIPTRVITDEELRRHVTPEDGWMAVGNLVYDVSGYWATHPGGNIINKHLGSDATKVFNKHHSWVNAQRLMPQRVLGRYHPTATKPPAPA